MASRLLMIFSAHYRPHVGGIEAFSEGLAKALINDRNKVIVVTNQIEETSEPLERGHNLTIVRLPCFALVNGRLPLPKFNRCFFDLWKQEVQNVSPDGVLINARFYPHTLLGVWYAKLKGVRSVVLDHGSAYLSFGNTLLDKLVIVYEHLMTWILKILNVHFYGISAASVAWLKTFNVSAEGIITNAIDARTFTANSSNRNFRLECGIKSNELVVSFAGRLVPEKGVSELIEAVDRLAPVPISVLIAGEGPLADYVKAKESERVHYLGKLGSADIASLYLQSDLMGLPTRSEGFCNAVLEASVCGTPSLITKVGIVDTLIEDGVSGFILPEVDAKTISDGLKQAYCRRESLRSMGSRCRKKAIEQYSWDAAVSSLYRACGISPVE